MKNGVYFIVIAFLFAELFKIWGYEKQNDLWRHIVDTKWCKITKYEISVQILSLRVEILQGWCAARTTHFDDGYDVTIAKYSYTFLK